MTARYFMSPDHPYSMGVRVVKSVSFIIFYVAVCRKRLTIGVICDIIRNGDRKVSRRSCLNGGGRFLFFGEVEIFFAFPDAMLTPQRGR